MGRREFQQSKHRTNSSQFFLKSVEIVATLESPNELISNREAKLREKGRNKEK